MLPVRGVIDRPVTHEDGRTHDGGSLAGRKRQVWCPGRIRTCAPASGGRDLACAPVSSSVLRAPLLVHLHLLPSMMSGRSSHDPSHASASPRRRPFDAASALNGLALSSLSMVLPEICAGRRFAEDLNARPLASALASDILSAAISIPL